MFSHPDVEQLELQGYRVISGLLEIYRPLLNLPLSDFTELVEKERVKRFPIETRAYSTNSRRAIGWPMSRLSVNYRQILLSFRYGNIITVAACCRIISAV